MSATVPVKLLHHIVAESHLPNLGSRFWSCFVLLVPIDVLVGCD